MNTDENNLSSHALTFLFPILCLKVCGRCGKYGRSIPWQEGEKYCLEVCPVWFHRTCLNTSFKIIFPHLPQYWHKGKALSLKISKRRGSSSLVIFQWLALTLRNGTQSGWWVREESGHRNGIILWCSRCHHYPWLSRTNSKRIFQLHKVLLEEIKFWQGEEISKEHPEGSKDQGIYPIHILQRCQETWELTLQRYLWFPQADFCSNYSHKLFYFLLLFLGFSSL